MGLENLQPGQQIVYLEENAGDVVNAVSAADATNVTGDAVATDETANATDAAIKDETGYAADTVDETDNASKEGRNVYIISTAPSAGNAVEGGEDGEEPAKKVIYKQINFQKIMENLSKAHEYIHIEDIEFPLSGVHYAQLVCDRIDMDVPVYWNDTSDILRYGAGQYLGSMLPGFGRMIVLSGHNNTFFAPLKNIKKNDIIEYNTNYCAYKYRVKDVQILNEKELQNYIYDHLLDEEEVLILYTCYPFEAMVGRKTDRLTVFAERISGYDVKWRDLDE